MTHPFSNFIIQNVVASRKNGTSSPGRGSNSLNFEKVNTKLFATSDSGFKMHPTTFLHKHRLYVYSLWSHLNLREPILAEHSKAYCIRIVKWIGNNQQRFDEMIKLFLHDEYMVVQRAGWPVSEVVIKYPLLIQPHLGNILRYVNKPDYIVQ